MVCVNYWYKDSILLLDSALGKRRIEILLGFLKEIIYAKLYICKIAYIFAAKYEMLEI